MPAEPFRDRYEAAEAAPFSDLSGGLVLEWRGVWWQGEIETAELVRAEIVWPSGLREPVGETALAVRMGRAWVEERRAEAVERLAVEEPETWADRAYHERSDAA